jgi:hypothetical protein
MSELRRSVGALVLFHGATIERALRFSASQMELAERSEATDPELRDAAGEQLAKIDAALEAFLALGKELQK